MEHSLLESLRTASQQASSRLSKLQGQHQSLREACNRAHDALHSYSDMDLLSNAAEIESELEDAALFPEHAAEDLAQPQTSVPSLEFGADRLFDEIAQFGCLMDNALSGNDLLDHIGGNKR